MEEDDFDVHVYLDSLSEHPTNKKSSLDRLEICPRLAKNWERGSPKNGILGSEMSVLTVDSRFFAKYPCVVLSSASERSLGRVSSIEVRGFRPTTGRISFSVPLVTRHK